MNPPRAFHILAKPIGPICNLDCKYCFYLEKEQLYPKTEKYRMRDEVLENFIRQYIESQDVPEINFAWQGGEPTLMGVDFYRQAVELQKKYAHGKKITNAFQTNGILLDEEWGRFLFDNQFLVGISIDGPKHLHDIYRVDKSQKPTFEKVMQGLDILKKYQVEFNTLTCVHRKNAQYPLEIYQFLKDIGSQYMQFIPLVERVQDDKAQTLGLDFAPPPVLEQSEEYSPVTNWSVPAKQFGQFMIKIFDEWVEYDVGEIFVQYFDVALANWMGMESPLCIFAKKCGKALAIEHDGTLYSCDHFVYPDYALGNVMNQSVESMVYSPQQNKFGNDKEDTLPEFCRKCEVRFACNGGCPKYRFIKTPDGESGLNYLCPGYKLFFNHIDPYMKVMAQLLQSGRPASEIMTIIKEYNKQYEWKKAKPNDPCPCGSGKKYKKCCAVKNSS